MATVATVWSSGIPWDQEPEYVAACRYQLQPGDPIAYNPPRSHGATPTDMTDFQVGSASWNINNLPAIFYVLWPCTEWKDFASSARPAQKVDANGNLMFERHPWPGTQPRPILDFPIFRNIDTISTEVEWELLEWWMRIDPRISWDDIEMRMEYVGKRAAYDHEIDLTGQEWPVQVEKAKAKLHNALNMKTMRGGRVPFNMLSWRNKKAAHERKNGPRDKVLDRLTPQQKAANSTRGATPGLIDVNAADAAANRVPLPGGRRHQRALPQVAPANVQQAQNSAPQNPLLQAQQQTNRTVQAQVLPPQVPQLEPGVPQQSNLQHPFQTPDVVSPQTVQPNGTYNGSAAPPFSMSRPQHPAPDTMAPSQPHQNQQVSQQSAPVTPQQARPPPPPSRTRGTLHGQSHSLGGVPAIQQRQIQQYPPQYVDPNFPQIRAAATPTPHLQSQYQVSGASYLTPSRQNQRDFRPPPPPPRVSNQQYRAAATQHPALQTPYPVFTAADAPQPTYKRTASSAFAGHGYMNGEVINLDDDEYDDLEPRRPPKRVRKDASSFKPVTSDDDADHLGDVNGEWNYQGLQNFLNSPDGGFGVSRPSVGGVSATSRGRPSVKEGKRKREPDFTPPPYEDSYAQQPQNYYPQPPPSKRQQLRSLSPRKHPVLPEDLEPESVTKHLVGIGQLPTTKPSKGRPPLPSSRAASASSVSSSLSQALSRAQKTREPNLGNQPTETGPSVIAGPNVQSNQHQGYGDSYVDSMSLVRMTSSASFQQWDHHSGRRVNRGLDSKNVLGSQTQHQRVTKNTSQRQPPVRKPNVQRFPANYIERLFTSGTNEHPRVTRPGSHEAGAGGYGVAGPDPEVKNTQGYMNQGPVPGSYSHTPSRSATKADHPSPPAYSNPSTLHPSSSFQHSPRHRSTTIQGPYPTPAKVDGTTPRLNPLSRGIQHSQAHGPSLTSSPFQEQLEPRLSIEGRRHSKSSDEDTARLFINKDGFSTRILSNSDEPNANNTEDEHNSATTEAFEAIDEEFFEALLRDEDQCRFSTEAIEIPDAYYAEAGFLQGHVDKWNAEAQATIDRLTQPSNDAADGDTAGPSTANAAAWQGDDAQSSSEKGSTEELPANELERNLSNAGSDASGPSTSSEEGQEVVEAPFSGPENMRLLDLPFDASKFSVEEENWLLGQDSSDLF